MRWSLVFLWAFCVFLLHGEVVFADSWQEWPGPSVILSAQVEPFVHISVSSEYEKDGKPLVQFSCDRGPGRYEGNPLTVHVSANVPIKIYCSATDLQGETGTIPATQLEVSFDDPEKPNDPFHPLSKEDKEVMVYNSPKPVSFETSCVFRIEITPREGAGQYEGQAFFTVLYRL